MRALGFAWSWKQKVRKERKSEGPWKKAPCKRFFGSQTNELGTLSRMLMAHWSSHCVWVAEKTLRTVKSWTKVCPWPFSRFGSENCFEIWKACNYWAFVKDRSQLRSWQLCNHGNKKWGSFVRTDSNRERDEDPYLILIPILIARIRENGHRQDFGSFSPSPFWRKIGGAINSKVPMRKWREISDMRGKCKKIVGYK